MSRETTCAFHSDVPAVTSCSQCGRPLCRACRQIIEGDAYCAEDARRRFGVRASNVGHPSLPPHAEIPPELEEDTAGLTASARLPSYWSPGGQATSSLIVFTAGIILVEYGVTGLLAYHILIGGLPPNDNGPLVVLYLVWLLMIGVGFLICLAGYAAYSGTLSYYRFGMATCTAGLVVCAFGSIYYGGFLVLSPGILLGISMGVLVLRHRSEQRAFARYHVPA